MKTRLKRLGPKFDTPPGSPLHWFKSVFPDGELATQGANGYLILF